MATTRCGLCGREAKEAELVWLRGLKGAVCRPGFGCDREHPGPRLPRLDDIVVDNPKH